MHSPSFDPEHLDVANFAAQGGELSGYWPLRSLERLYGVTDKQAGVNAEDEVSWHLCGEVRRARASDKEIWLTVKAEAKVRLQCQRCLQPMLVTLRSNSDIRFVAGEEQAAALDEESDEDVLALSRSLDAKSLIEDELLLALPLVPKHDSCPEPLIAPTNEVEESQQPHPFAALAKLKSGGSL